MISTPTTLVLGAGASMPYGFPSGAKLREQLCDVGFMHELVRIGYFNKDEVEEFCKVFLRSGMASIDAFLARRGEHEIYYGGPTFSEVGKAGIALSLIQCERLENLFNFKIEDNWYHYLWQLIGDSLEGLGENKLSIITFNYDRSLEAFLLAAIQNAFGVSVEIAAENLLKIPIVHVYGKIGDLSCLNEGSSNCREFTPMVTQREIRVGASGIRVIAEHRDNSSEFALAQQYLRTAKRICFLGFGFDSTNVKRLDLTEVLSESFVENQFSGPMIYSTSLGMLRAERDRLNGLVTGLGVSINPQTPYFHRYDSLRSRISANIQEASDQKNLNYLRHTGVLHGPQ